MPWAVAAILQPWGDKPTGEYQLVQRRASFLDVVLLNEPALEMLASGLRDEIINFHCFSLFKSNVLLLTGQITPTIIQGLFKRGVLFHLLIRTLIPMSMILFLHQNFSLILTNTLTWRVWQYPELISLFLHLLAMRPWASDFTALGPQFSHS